MKKKLSKISYLITLIIFIVVYVLSIYLKTKFKSVTTEQIVYSLLYPEGTSFDAVKDGLIYVTIRTILILIIIFIVKYLLDHNKNKVFIKIGNKNNNIDLLKLTKPKKIVFLIVIIIMSLFSMTKALKIDEYIKMQRTSSSIFDDYYVNPKSTSIIFPEEKQNLIYIFVESMEMTNASKDNGGLIDSSYIPNLETLALTNHNFSNTNKLGGAYKATGTSWTAASLISQTSAVPLKLQIDTSGYKGYKESLPGVYSIGEVLKDNGYKNYFMLGSDANYGGRREYFTYHGNYKIMDYYYALEEEWIPEDYHVWWGYEDKLLYEFAKKELTSISKNNEPFNFTILTADTHFEDGYTDVSCPNYFENPYANSVYCTDIMLNKFINWIKKQDFYKNTTIIITGDHLTMQSDFYDDIIDDNYNRTIYNTIINSKIELQNNKNRTFTLLDMYPTTLASLGVIIDGDRLGLGTNLYSGKKTLPEKLGYNYFNKELDRKSLFYDTYLVKDIDNKVKEEVIEE